MPISEPIGKETSGHLCSGWCQGEFFGARRGSTDEGVVEVVGVEGSFPVERVSEDGFDLLGAELAIVNGFGIDGQGIEVSAESRGLFGGEGATSDFLLDPSPGWVGGGGSIRSSGVVRGAEASGGELGILDALGM